MKPANQKLYNSIKQKIKRKMVWPSIYASSALVREYKKAGGQYIGSKHTKGGLSRWYSEKWTDVCTMKPCGRHTFSTRKYPKCRPAIRVSKETPITIDEIKQKFGPSFLKTMCTHKQKYGLPYGSPRSRRSKMDKTKFVRRKFKR